MAFKRTVFARIIYIYTGTVKIGSKYDLLLSYIAYQGLAE